MIFQHGKGGFGNHEKLCINTPLKVSSASIMPKCLRGGNSALSDHEVKLAADYMIALVKHFNEEGKDGRKGD
jgi:hypothetical protein